MTNKLNIQPGNYYRLEYYNSTDNTWIIFVTEVNSQVIGYFCKGDFTQTWPPERQLGALADISQCRMATEGEITRLIEELHKKGLTIPSIQQYEIF